MLKNFRVILLLGGAALQRWGCHPLTRSASATAVALVLAFLLPTFAFGETGAETFRSRCAACHGVNGAGDTMIGKNLKLRSLASPEVQKQSDEELFLIINKGRNRMPAFDRKLPGWQIRELVKHIRSLKQ